jgi:two-component system cell cycle sensor histidine kinase/response regulator CckA
MAAGTMASCLLLRGGMPLTGDNIGQSNAVTPDGSDTGQPLAADGTRIRALAIDDDEEFLKLIKELLEPFGVEVQTVANPVRALEMFAQQKDKFHLVLLDYKMPKLDGTQTFEWLKKLNPNVKVIIVSGVEELRLRPILAKHPIDGYIRKPVAILEALHIIRHVITQTEPKPVAH